MVCQAGEVRKTEERVMRGFLVHFVLISIAGASCSKPEITGDALTRANAAAEQGSQQDANANKIGTAPTVNGVVQTNDTTPTWTWSPSGAGNGSFRFRLNNDDLTSSAASTTKTMFTPESPLTDGRYTLYVQEQSKRGDWSPSGAFSTIVDSKPPTLAFTVVGAGNSQSNLRPNILGTTSESATVTLFFDAACTVSKSKPTSNLIFAKGGIALTSDVGANTTTSIYGVAIDDAGNQTSCILLTSYSHDDRAPEPPTLSVGSSTFRSAFAVTLAQNASSSAPDFKEFRYSISNSLTPPFAPSCAAGKVGSSIMIEATAPGTSISVIACDTDDKASVATTATYTYTPDLRAAGDATSSALGQRKTFYHSATGHHWAFWRQGSSTIQYGYSVNGTDFYAPGTGLEVPADQFTISVNGDRVFLAYTADEDIELLRGTISGTSIRWGPVSVAMDASGVNDAFLKSAMTVAKNGEVYMAAFRRNSTGGTYSVFAGQINDYSNPRNVGAVSIPNSGTVVPQNMALVPYGDYVMAIVAADGGGIRSFTFNGTTWSANSGDITDWTLAGDFQLSIVSTARIRALAVNGNELYVGGAFASVGRAVANYIAKWDGLNWHALGKGLNGQVHALAVIGTDVYVGGYFTLAGGAPANYIAKWTGSNWVPLGEGISGSPSAPQRVNALAVIGTDLYVGGDFNMAGRVPARGLAKWNGSSWEAVGGDALWSAETLAAKGSDLYVGGDFKSLVGNIAKWNGSSWQALGSGVKGHIGAIAVSGSDIYVGGDFTSAGGLEVNRIAKWDGSNWRALGSGVNDRVSSLSVIGTDIYVGGDFTSAGGIAAKQIAKWNASGWQPVGNGVSDRVDAILAYNGTVFAGGEFGLMRQASGLVAMTQSFSAASDTAGTHLAYIDSRLGKPYYRILKGTSWGTAEALSDCSLCKDIVFSVSKDGLQRMVAWESNSRIEYRKYSSGMWGALKVVQSSATSNRFPTLPEIINSSIVPIVWTGWSSDKTRLLSTAVSFP